MLNSLHIKNYRNLKDFKIDKLLQVNLITGGNNTGKSTLLDAIATYASKGDFGVIFYLLERRGEYYKPFGMRTETEANARSLTSLFTDRESGMEQDVPNIISIGDDKHTLELGYVRDGNGYNFHFQTRIGDKSSLFMEVHPRYPNFTPGKDKGDSDVFQFIGTWDIDWDINGKLFDNVVLTEKESSVIEALKVIEPSTARIAFIDPNPHERTAVIKLSGQANVFLLRSMGDGINRILTMILALVNSTGGYLLIDEFENGLHYAAQEQMWKIIFRLAQELNVQVFATTHSNDCISGFEAALNDPDNTVEGKLIRLDKEDGEIKGVEFPAQYLEIAERRKIEIR
jgi:AAA15 family ATPase/GTPase